MPDDAARSAVAETLRVGVVKMGDTCLLNFRFLKSYIEGAFADEDVWDAQFKAAGQNYYADAANGDWESMELMNQSAKNYLNTNNALLVGVAPNLNMPAAFGGATGTYGTAATNFTAQYLLFKSAEETSVATAAKIIANNNVYKTTIKMMKDGQLIFDGDDETKKMFTFSSIWDLINPPVAGIKGQVKVSGTNTPIGGATISIQKDGEVAQDILTEDDGTYSHQLGAGNYTIKVSAAGYVSQTKTVEMKADGYKTFDWVMVNV
jgi:hypothetical protein